MNEEIKVDVTAMQEQRKEEIRKSEKYMEVSITIPRIDSKTKDCVPVVQVIGKSCNNLTEYTMIKVLQSTLETIRNRIENYDLIEKVYNFNVEDFGIFEKRDNNE